LLNQAGLSPLQTLQSATIRPAEFLRVSDELGSVSQGKFADLVLLRSDPLNDIRNTTAIDAVILRGKLLNRAQLDGLLRKVVERAKPTRQLMKTLKWGEG
jgi:imidazolonepropionase-like amidohydrolase